MRIAVVHNLQSGGAARRTANQIAHLDDVHEVCLSTATPLTAGADVIGLPRASDRLPRAARPPARYLDHALLETAWARVRRHVRDLRVDVVMLNPCRFLQGPPVCGEGLPPVLYFCDEPRRVDAEPQAAQRVNPRTRGLYGPLYRRSRSLDRRTVATVDLIATNSHYTASEIERVYGRRATVVTLGVADRLLAPRAPVAQGDYLLSVGTLIAGKGHDLVIRAAALSSTRRTVRIVAPRADPAEDARLHDLARRHAVELDLRIGVSDGELADAYAGAFATLYLAEREPLGLASLEAQALGCPVIVSDEGGLPETIVDGATGWCCPRDPAPVAALLDRLADPRRRAEMAQAARSHARTFTWKRSAAQIERLLQTAAMTAG